jgi:hypothetical protein
MNRKSYISVTCRSKKQSAKKKSSKKVGTLTIAAAIKRPDRAFLYPEMVMQYINSYMKNKIIIICLSMLLLIACNNNDGRESFGDKTEWSVLQSIEYELRGQKNAEFKILETKGYYIAIIPNEAGAIAILLNPDFPPFYKQMPNIQFNLSNEQYEKILTNKKITSTVQEVLESHLIK